MHGAHHADAVKLRMFNINDNRNQVENAVDEVFYDAQEEWSDEEAYAHPYDVEEEYFDAHKTAVGAGQQFESAEAETDVAPTTALTLDSLPEDLLDAVARRPGVAPLLAQVSQRLRQDNHDRDRSADERMRRELVRRLETDVGAAVVSRDTAALQEALDRYRSDSDAAGVELWERDQHRLTV